jgi:hypothetical protein
MDDALTYSFEARIRVALSVSAAQASTIAISLVPTYGEYGCPPGELAAEAASAARHATEALTYAVACERQRGTSWERIAEALDDDADAVRERYEGPVAGLQRRLLETWLDPELGHRLPEGADDPTGRAAHLDAWLTGRARGDEDFRWHPDTEIRDHPVSAGLAVMSAAEHRRLLGAARRLIAARAAGGEAHAGPDGERRRRAEIGLYRRRVALLEWLLAEEVNDPAVTGLGQNALRALLRAARRRLTPP